MEHREPYHGQPARRPRLTPGSTFLEVKKGTHQCGGCKAPVLVVQVRDENQTLKWKNFEPKPWESPNGHRYYYRHFCPR